MRGILLYLNNKNVDIAMNKPFRINSALIEMLIRAEVPG